MRRNIASSGPTNLVQTNQTQGKGEVKVGLAGLSGVSDFFVQACSSGSLETVANVTTSNNSIPTALWLAENEVMKVRVFIWRGDHE